MSAGDFVDVDVDGPATSSETPHLNGEWARPAAPARTKTSSHEWPSQRPVAYTPAGRELPHNREAEEFLLSCCLLDGADVIARCVQANLRPASFFFDAHSIIFDRLLDLFNRQEETDISIVAQELATAKQLEAVGGYTFLMQVSSRIPTTAQAGYFIEKVREQALLRDLIRTHTGAVEECYNFSGGIDELLAEQQSRFRSIEELGAVATRSPLRALTEFTVPPDGDDSVLLGNRYLNRGDAAVVSGPSGMGKSTMAVQMATLFSLGRPAFGIPPNGALTSLVVQSEDSDGDVAEMQLSVAHALELSPADRAAVGSRVKVWSERVLRGSRFIAALRRKIDEVQPDLVWINPLQAYIDGDVTDSQDLGRFLREGLNGLNDHRFGYVIIHHTTKPPTGKDRQDRQWHEVQYDMAGGAEIINFARAILSLRATAEQGQFNLVLAKRGRRAGVTKMIDQGAGLRVEPVMTIPLRHAKGFIPAKLVGLTRDLPLMFWEPRPEDEPPADGVKGKRGRPAKYSFDTYRAVLRSKHSGREKSTSFSILYREARTVDGISEAQFRNLLREAKESGDVAQNENGEWFFDVPGTGQAEPKKGGV